MQSPSPCLAPFPTNLSSWRGAGERSKGEEQERGAGERSRREEQERGAGERSGREERRTHLGVHIIYTASDQKRVLNRVAVEPL